MANFNKLINLSFQTNTGKSFTIKTPIHGPKPQIEISGNLTMEGYSHNIEIRLTNFYTDSIDGDITSVSVEAGYEGAMSAGVFGTVQNMYTETPGPDKVTVISCVSASYDRWINSTIDMKLKEGFTLETAITQISNALGYDRAIIDVSISGLTCAAPLQFNGRCTEALSKVKEAFPGVTVVVDGNKLRVYPTEAKQSSVIVHNLALLAQAPQFTGGTVNIVAPWNPMIKPGDYVHFPTSIRRQSLGAITADTAQVNTIQFHFATNTDVNEMVITGTPTSKLKEATK
jgi:hypothetical protein